MLGLFILVITGAVIGWLLSVATSTRDTQDVLAMVLAGTGGGVLAGLAVASGPILEGISGPSLLVAICGAIMASAALGRTQKFLKH